MPKLGLVLTGGGARAAYQVGVLNAVADILPDRRAAFPIISGMSAGAINGAVLAAEHHDFRSAVTKLRCVWEGLQPDMVYRTGAASLVRRGIKLIRELTTSGLATRRPTTHLLNTQPLHDLIDRNVDFDMLAAHVRSGALHGVSFTATNYNTGSTLTFFDAHPDIQPWIRNTRLSRRARLTSDHVMASAAIPFFFPPVRLGQSYFGDGCIRGVSPLSPAIHLGAEKILAVELRCASSDQHVLERNNRPMERISLVNIAGVMLNALFQDSLEVDLERVERINRTVRLLHRRGQKDPDGLREIPVLAIRPSRDLGCLAYEELGHFPAALRYLLHGIGATNDKGRDLLSYLAFEYRYVRQVIRLGYDDAMARADELRDFLQDDDCRSETQLRPASGQ